MKIFDYIHSRGGEATVESSTAPDAEWEAFTECFEELRDYEHAVTTAINELVDLAIESKDHATRQFLDFFVAEQVTSEATMDTMVAKVKAYSVHTGLMWHLDAELD